MYSVLFFTSDNLLRHFVSFRAPYTQTLEAVAQSAMFFFSLKRHFVNYYFSQALHTLYADITYLV